MQLRPDCLSVTDDADIGRATATEHAEQQQHRRRRRDDFRCERSHDRSRRVGGVAVARVRRSAVEEMNTRTDWRKAT